MRAATPSQGYPRMMDSVPQHRNDAPLSGGPVEMLAGRALMLLARRRTAPRPRLSETFVTRLRETALDPDPGRRGRLVDVMREAHIADDTIVDHYIPEVARRLGVDWVENRLSFAEVTVGSARLQSIVRDLLADPAPDFGGGPSVAVLVAPDETHTLGAAVIASQLRRQGAAVTLTLDGADPVADGSYDAVFVSVATSAALVTLPDFVKKLRVIYGGAPIVVGGAAIGRKGNAKDASGADHVATDISEAIRLCGLRTSPGQERTRQDCARPARAGRRSAP